MEERFVDAGARIGEFMDDILVVCPKCSACASSRRLEFQPRNSFDPRRVVCAACGFTRDWAEQGISYASRRLAVDDYFHFSLWLQAPCCGEVLWAYNLRHLQFIEDFVRARLRERSRDAVHGWHNSSLASRLPTWIKEAKNRDAILNAIDGIRSNAAR